MKRFFDLNFRGGDYAAADRRKGAKTPWDGSERKPNPQPKPMKKPRPEATPVRAAGARAKESEDAPALNKQIAELRMTTDTLEKERDFYFGKLRAIELFCEHHQDQENPVIQEIQKVLYATDDETITVNEDGTLTITPIET